MSGPVEYFIGDIGNRERSKLNTNKLSSDQHDRNKVIDMGRLTRLMLVWMVGAVVSLIPDIMNFFIVPDLSVAFEEIFSKPNIFVVTTTLTVSVLLEMIFDRKNSNTKYVILAFQIILIVFCVHISGALNSGTAIKNVHKIGFTTLTLCFLVGFLGYVIVCVGKGGDINDNI